jgi:hypothetical protein
MIESSMDEKYLKNSSLLSCCVIAGEIDDSSNLKSLIYNTLKSFNSNPMSDHEQLKA